MRLNSPSNVTLQSQTPNTFVFSGDAGEHIRVSILEHDIVRVQHWPEGMSRLERTWLVVDKAGEMPREGRQRDDLSPFSLPQPTATQSDNTMTLQTDTLKITIQSGDFVLRVIDSSGQTFHEDLGRVGYSYNRAGQDVFHYVKRQTGEHYYGFGERSGALSKAGRRMRMLNLDSLGYNAESTDPLYKHCPFYITFNPTLNIAYGLFYDNLATTTFDMGKEIDAYRGTYRYYHAEGGDLDYYLIYGPTIAEVIEKYTRLTGRPALFPRWILGYLGSTMTYTEAENAQEQLKQFALLCREHDIPCDLFHLSSGYTTNENNERCVFTWNHNRVPDPQAMVDDFHHAGIRMAANIKPYILKTHPNYNEIVASGGFIQQAESDEPQISRFWSGGVNVMGDGAYLDFTSEAGYGWWQEKLRSQLLDYGIDAAWNDNNEYEIWDDDARCDGFGSNIPVGLARPLHSLLMAHASYHTILDKHPQQRPYVLSRSGAPGIQRYAQSWTGDNATSWNDLRYNISMVLGSGLSGIPNTGNDVGGFFGPMPDPELLVRWVQSHIFLPRFCIHSWNLDQSATEPWTYPDVLPIIREAIHFRYRLMPYLYTLFFETSQTGQPIARPLVYHFPHDTNCHTESFDFMLGPYLLVASVLEDGVRSRSVYLPSGVSWCDFYTGTWYDGGQTITIDAPLEHIPIFIREGGMIPTGKVMNYVGAEPDDLRQVYLFPSSDGVERQFTLIEDDGVSFDYRNGGYSGVNITVLADSDSDTVNVSVDVSPRGFDLPYKEIVFILPPDDTRTLTGDRIWKNENGQNHSAITV